VQESLPGGTDTAGIVKNVQGIAAGLKLDRTTPAAPVAVQYRAATAAL